MYKIILYAVKKACVLYTDLSGSKFLMAYKFISMTLTPYRYSKPLLKITSVLSTQIRP